MSAPDDKARPSERWTIYVCPNGHQCPSDDWDEAWCNCPDDQSIRQVEVVPASRITELEQQLNGYHENERKWGEWFAYVRDHEPDILRDHAALLDHARRVNEERTALKLELRSALSEDTP